MIPAPRRRPRRVRDAGLAILLVVAGCDDAAQDPARAPEESPYPDSARVEVHQQMVEARAAVYGPGDGGGSARLLEASDVRCGELGRWVVEYDAGPEGVDVGGIFFFQVSPFWHWSDPQVVSSEHPGYTEIEVDAPDVELAPQAIGQQCLLLEVRGRALREGETFRVTYGAGAGARADRYAEDGEMFYLWLDSDGDGSRRLVGGDLTFAVQPREPVDLLVTLPSTAAVGDTVEVNLAFLDGVANAAPGFVGEVTLRADEGMQLAETVEFVEEHRGHRRVSARIDAEGVYRVVAEFDGVERQSNPLVVSGRSAPILWADLQIHSGHSDGTGTAENIYTYARDVAALDVASLTDHDHWGMRMLDETPEVWEHIRRVTREFHEPGRFVTLLGYEWTSWLWGHRHVLYFGDEGDIHSSVVPPTDTPTGLWEALRGKNALTVAHHPAGGPVAVDWTIAPPPDIEPVVEIVSVHGSSESRDSPRGIYRGTDGHFVRDALAHGYRLGFIGSTDGHDGHPGLAHRNAPSGGIAAILATEHTRDAVKQALLQRRTYATSGVRIYVEFGLGDRPMGSEVALDQSAGAPYTAFAVGTAPLRHLDLVKNGAVLYRLEVGGVDDTAHLNFVDPERQSGDHVYLRVVQEDDHAAWSSPIWTR